MWAFAIPRVLCGFSLLLFCAVNLTKSWGKIISEPKLLQKTREEDEECIRLLQNIQNRTQTERLFCLSVIVGEGARITSRGMKSFGRHQFYVDTFVRYFTRIARSGKLKKSGNVILRADDYASLGSDVEEVLLDHGIPLASHAYRGCEHLPSHVVMIPDPVFIQSRGIIFRNLGQPYHQREPQVFWRGSTTGYGNCMRLQRVRMVTLANSTPWTNIKISNLVQHCGAKNREMFHDLHLIGEKKPEEFWCNYRGIIDIDGNANAWGLLWRLSSGSVTFRVDSSFCGIYGFHLKPWVHYIPIRSDLSDFRNVTSLVMSTDKNVINLLAHIASRASKYAAMYSYDAVAAKVVEQLHKVWSE